MHRVNKLAVLTASFPVGPAEGFLAAELDALRQMDCQICVFPLWPRGSTRQVSSLSAENSNVDRELRFLIEPLLSSRVLFAFFNELICSPKVVFSWLLRLASEGRSWKIRAKNILVLPKAAWLATQLRLLKAEHLHAHWSSTTATCAMIAADLVGIRWSMTCHRWDIYEDNLLALKVSTASFSRFISQRGFRDAVKMGVDVHRCRVIRMGVRLPSVLQDATHRQSGGRLVLMCAANIIAVKGHRYLIQAVQRLIVQGDDIKLLLAGDGALRGDMESLVISLNLSDRVEFLGHISHAALLEMYRQGQIDAFVLPSVDLGQGVHEGIPVSLMEAMAHTVPVISTQTGSIEELLPRSMGVTVPDKDSESLAQVIHAFASDEGFRLRIAIEQRKIAERWSADMSASELFAAIFP